MRRLSRKAGSALVDLITLQEELVFGDNMDASIVRAEAAVIVNPSDQEKVICDCTVSDAVEYANSTDILYFEDEE